LKHALYAPVTRSASDVDIVILVFATLTSKLVRNLQVTRVIFMSILGSLNVEYPTVGVRSEAESDHMHTVNRTFLLPC